MERAAFLYAEMGYPVLPCARLSKRPVTPHGLKDASTHPPTILRWWRETVHANLAILPPPAVLVLDADDPYTADLWEAEHPELQAAPKVRTPRGGVHLYLRMPDSAIGPKVRVSVGPEGRKVDIRGLGRAYVLAPPSLTREGRYRWERPLLPPPALPLAGAELLAGLQPQAPVTPPAPTTLPVMVSSLRARRYALGALQGEHDRVKTARQGTRNDTLNRAAYALGGYVAHALLLREEVEMALMIAADACGLPSAEATRTIRSGLKAGVQAPRPLPDTEPETTPSPRLTHRSSDPTQ